MSNTDVTRELRIISSHLIAQMDDLSHTRNRLDELRRKKLSKRLDTVVGKLYDLTCAVDDEIRRLSE